MNHQKKTRVVLRGSLILVGLIVAISYSSTSSPSPLGVYESGGIAAKVGVSILGLMLFAGVFQFVVLSLMRSIFARIAGKPADDIQCAECGLPLFQYMGSHGMPVRCIRCNSLFHGGAACLGKAQKESALKMVVPSCPACENAFDELGPSM